MKILMMVHSNTGHTLEVAHRLESNYRTKGHQVTIKPIVALDDREYDVNKVVLVDSPILEEADVYIFGAPVRAFQLSPVMRNYLHQVDTLENKSVYCYLTQYFPFRFLGGNHAMKQFQSILKSKNAKIQSHFVVNWSATKKRSRLIESMIADFSKI